MEKEITRLTADRQRLSGAERGILVRLDQLAAEARLLDARIERFSILLANLNSDLMDLGRREARVEQDLTAARIRLRQTVSVLHQAGPLARLRLALDTEDAERLTAGWRLAHELTSRQREEVSRIRTGRQLLFDLHDQSRKKAEELALLSKEAEAARAALAVTIRDRRTLLNQVREEQSIRRQAIDELERASGELEGILSGKADPHPVAVDVTKFRGLLLCPVKGPILRPFGERRDVRFGTVLPHRGWDIGAPFGETVRAPFEGRVVFASWFRGYGLMVVIDHGRGIHSVLAHLSAVLVSKGDEVAKGQLIGQVGDTGSLSGPSLYLEVRRNGKAEDPARWIEGRVASAPEN